MSVLPGSRIMTVAGPRRKRHRHADTGLPRRPPAPPRCRRGRRGTSAATLVEFCVVAPIVLIVIFLLIDFGRLVYTMVAISNAAREGQRLISLKPNETSDCYALQQVESVGQGFTISPDPSSLQGNSDPNSPTGTLTPTTPPMGQGYIYIWPAVAQSAPQDATPNCNGNPRLGSSTVRQVAVKVSYHFVPWTPLVASIVPDLVVSSISVGQTEY